MHLSHLPPWTSTRQCFFSLDQFPHSSSLQATCRHRLVKCPGLDCPTKIPLSRLKDHALACCVERAEIKPHPLPHRSDRFDSASDFI